jgi:hypothetical protein
MKMRQLYFSQEITKQKRIPIKSGEIHAKGKNEKDALKIMERGKKEMKELQEDWGGKRGLAETRSA